MLCVFVPWPERLICSGNPNPLCQAEVLAIQNVFFFFPPLPPDFWCRFVQLSVGQKLDFVTKVHRNDFSDFFFEGSQGLCKFACFSIFGFV